MLLFGEILGDFTDFLKLNNPANKPVAYVSKSYIIAQKKKHAKRVLNYVRCSVSIIHARDS